VPICVVPHRSRHFPDLLPRVLASITRLKVKGSARAEQMEGGTVSVAPSDSHRVVNLDRVLRGAASLACVVMLAAARPAAAQVSPTARPEGVTDSSIAWGRQLFHGSANCAACHGQDARGTDEGPALTGALWLHGPGTYRWLVEQIKRGIPAHRTWTGTPMPMRGWSNMPDEDVRAVAAYVWSITHPPRPPPKSRPRPS
jgi:mono/diheme cytochrome c family protein